MDDKRYRVFYRAPQPEPQNRLCESSLATKELALNLFAIHKDSVMVVKCRGWFKRVIVWRQDQAVNPTVA